MLFRQKLSCLEIEQLRQALPNTRVILFPTECAVIDHVNLNRNCDSAYTSSPDASTSHGIAIEVNFDPT